MTTTTSIAELQHAGVTLEAGEAVAVTQQLIQTLRRSDDAGVVEPPYGPPTAANVILNADGTVSCAACGTTPAISEIAIFLDALLPAGSPGVPGGLRYAIARGLLEVDVAPFDSLDDFSRALSRHESGPRAELVRRLFRRLETVRPVAPGVPVERRRARTTELRRALREADARLYVCQFDATIAILPPPARPRIAPAVAVCLGSGLILIAASELMHRQPSPSPAVTPLAPLAAVRTADASAMPLMAFPLPANGRAAALRPIERQTRARAIQASAGAPGRAANAARRVRPVPATPANFGRTDRTSAGPAARTSEAAVRRGRSPRTSRGILDHLRLRWLRNAFSLES